MEKSSSTPYGGREIRCPKLGGQVAFEYCRMEARDLPCSRAIVCWSAYFDVEAFFRESLLPEEFDRIFSTPPQPKLVTLMELIDQARKAALDSQKQQ